jgi:hypothetical protein
MILCDRVSVDPATKKSTLHGCFKTFAAARFPVTHPALAVHVMLTNGRGAVSIALHLVDVDEDQRIFTFEVPVEFPDPLATVDLTFAVRDVCSRCRATTGSSSSPGGSFWWSRSSK